MCILSHSYTNRSRRSSLLSTQGNYDTAPRQTVMMGSSDYEETSTAGKIQPTVYSAIGQHPTPWGQTEELALFFNWKRASLWTRVGVKRTHRWRGCSPPALPPLLPWYEHHLLSHSFGASAAWAGSWPVALLADYSRSPSTSCFVHVSASSFLQEGV